MSIIGFSARTVVEEPSVSDAIQSSKAEYSRVEDLYDALIWRLARKPDSGMRLETSVGDIYLIKTPSWGIAGVPVITALYSFDDNQIIVHSVKIDNGERK